MTCIDFNGKSNLALPDHVPPRQRQLIFDMGFSEAVVRDALSRYRGDEARAVEYLLNHQPPPPPPPQQPRKFSVTFMHEGAAMEAFAATAATAQDLVLRCPPCCIAFVVMFAHQVSLIKTEYGTGDLALAYTAEGHGCWLPFNLSAASFSALPSSIQVRVNQPQPSDHAPPPALQFCQPPAVHPFDIQLQSNEEHLVKLRSNGLLTPDFPCHQRAILVLGGSFNPPHRGHVDIFEEAKAHCASKGIDVVAGDERRLNCSFLRMTRDACCCPCSLSISLILCTGFMLCATDAHVQDKKVSLQLSERERIQLCTAATSTKSAPIYRPHILNLIRCPRSTLLTPSHIPCSPFVSVFPYAHTSAREVCDQICKRIGAGITGAPLPASVSAASCIAHDLMTRRMNDRTWHVLTVHRRLLAVRGRPHPIY